MKDITRFTSLITTLKSKGQFRMMGKYGSLVFNDDYTQVFVSNNNVTDMEFKFLNTALKVIGLDQLSK